MKNYDNLLKKTKKLCTTAQNLFLFVESIGKLHNITNLFSVWLLENRIHRLETYTCSTFQLFVFFKNIFGALEDSQILQHKK